MDLGDLLAALMSRVRVLGQTARIMSACHLLVYRRPHVVRSRELVLEDAHERYNSKWYGRSSRRHCTSPQNTVVQYNVQEIPVSAASISATCSADQCIRGNRRILLLVESGHYDRLRTQALSRFRAPRGCEDRVELYGGRESSTVAFARVPVYFGGSVSMETA